MKKLIYLLLLFSFACGEKATDKAATAAEKVDSTAYFRKKMESFDPETPYKKLYESKPAFLSDGFDFPVGKPNGKGFFVAQKFTENHHLGEDWNGIGGGNSDLGAPIYAIANGYVAETEDYRGGWGNVIRVVHCIEKEGKRSFVESLYAHCEKVQVKTGDWVKRGQQIGTVGTAWGKYKAHLHLEIRDKIGLALGGGYSENTFGLVSPSKFIKENRPKE